MFLEQPLPEFFGAFKAETPCSMFLNFAPPIPTEQTYIIHERSLIVTLLCVDGVTTTFIFKLVILAHRSTKD